MKPNPANVFRILGVIPECLRQMNPVEAAQLRALWAPLADTCATRVDGFSEEEIVKRFGGIADQLQQLVKATPLLHDEFPDFASHTRFNVNEYIADQEKSDILRNIIKISNEVIRLQVEMEKNNTEQAKDQEK